jgi:hypothetical protein
MHIIYILPRDILVRVWNSDTGGAVVLKLLYMLVCNTFRNTATTYLRVHALLC